MKRAWLLTVPLFVLSLCGIFISYLLLDKHLLGTHGPSWFASVCGDEVGTSEADSATSQPATTNTALEEQRRREKEMGEPLSEGGANCDSVLASRWGTIPPQPLEGEEQAEGAGGTQKPVVYIPSAYLGLVYFIWFAIWFLFVGQPTPDRREWYRLVLAANVCGVCSALFFIFIMFTQSNEWCPWCMVTHVINFLILGGMLLLRPARAQAVAHLEKAVAVSDAMGTPPPAPASDSESSHVQPHPSYRLMAACILLAAASGAMVWNSYAAQLRQKENKLVLRELEGFKSDAGLLVEIYKKSPKVKIPLRPDDPQIANGKILCPLVVFSDFECPWCGKFAKILETKIQPLFYNHLRVTWKHFPLATECNKTIKYNVHPRACKAARAAEAVRIQGGSEAFWKAHDLLFASRRRLKGFDYKAMAEQLGLDTAKFEADMNSPEVAARIAEDIELAKSLGVRSTPTIFLSGRRVETKLVSVDTFWQQMASVFNSIRDKRIHAQKQKELRQQKAETAASQPATRGGSP
ncbi:MAG: DsbA family protein [Phycisphaerae bacterium]|nr:DsbA family protein [Phycisphaerae bacterium]